MIVIGLVVLGLLLGSFVNALVWRLHEQDNLTEGWESDDPRRLSGQDLSIATGRSMCPRCHHALAAKDLIPVISWLSLRGKCRYCHKPIDQDTPFSELLVPVLFVISYLWWPLALSGYGLLAFCFWLAFMTGFTALAIYDIRWFLLPDRIVYPLIGLAATQVAAHAWLANDGWHVLVAAGWGVVCLAGVFYAIYLVSRRRWIGFGDVKLGIALGLLVGGPLQAFLLLFIASLLGSVVAIPLLVRRRATAMTPLPFGPFLLVAAGIVVLLGGSVISWYARLLVI